MNTATPKLVNQLQEVHQNTIWEENETMRGSIERGPGQFKKMHGTNKSSAANNTRKLLKN